MTAILFLSDMRHEGFGDMASPIMLAASSALRFPGRQGLILFNQEFLNRLERGRIIMPK